MALKKNFSSIYLHSNNASEPQVYQKQPNAFQKPVENVLANNKTLLNSENVSKNIHSNYTQEKLKNVVSKRFYIRKQFQKH